MRLRIPKDLWRELDLPLFLNQRERERSLKDLQLGDMPSQQALGVKWNLESVAFGFRVKVKEKPPTHSGILSLVSLVYDPLGFASPFVSRT